MTTAEERDELIAAHHEGQHDDSPDGDDLSDHDCPLCVERAEQDERWDDDDADAKNI